MPREQAVNIQNDFTQGLITETTPLRFPENACTDADNVVFDETARACVRNCIDVETGYVADTVASTTNDYFTSYLWENVAGSGTTTFLVEQVGNLLQFYDVSTSTTVSANVKTFDVDLDDYKTDTGFDTTLAACQYTSVNGDLIVVHPFCNPLAVQYNVGAEDISVTEIELKVRDLVGLDDTLGLNERVSSTYANLITSQPLHYYNLLNQGWFDEVLNQWDTARGDMPSNGDYVALSRASLTDSFDDSILTSLEPPTRLAPRGKFILGLGVYDRETAITDAGFTAATLTGTSSSKLITDMGTYVTIGNFTDSGKAFDGVNNNTASNSAKARSTVDNSGDMVFNTDYTLGANGNIADIANLNDGDLSTVATGGGGITYLRYNISPDAKLNRITIREDSDNGPTDEWYAEKSGQTRDIVWERLLSSVSVDTARPEISDDEALADYDLLLPAGVTTDELYLRFVYSGSNPTAGEVLVSQLELYKSPTLTSAQYIGKDFMLSGKQIVSVKIWPSTDEGIHNQGIDIGWSAKLYGSNTAPTNSTDGTLLGTTTNAQNTTGSISITSSDSVTFYRYVWVNVEVTDEDFAPYDDEDYIYINELQFFEVDTSPGEEGLVTNQRPSCVTTMNSRLFYGGINTRALSNIIYFTQVLEDPTKYGKCYQNNDPTSENFSVLLSSDGGEIKINDMGKLYKMMTYEGSLLAFASNGVWRIWNQQGGFDATSFRIDRISDIGTTSPKSFIEVNGVPFWWGEEGIYRVEYNPQFRSFSVQSVSDERIRTHFLSIPVENRTFVTGAYDISESQAIWLYNDAAALQDSDKHRFDKALCYNTITKAFYPWSFSDSSVIKIRDIHYIRTSSRQIESIIKFAVTTNETSMVFADMSSTNFIDWYELADDIGDTSERNSYDAYFIAGYRIKGQLQRFHQPNYVYMFMEEHDTATNSSYLQTHMDFANSSLSNKWTTTQQLYNSAMTYRDVNFRKLKVRGKGRAMQFKVSNDPGNFFCVLGWSVKDVGNADL